MKAGFKNSNHLMILDMDKPRWYIRKQQLSNTYENRSILSCMNTINDREKILREKLKVVSIIRF